MRIFPVHTTSYLFSASPYHLLQDIVLPFRNNCISPWTSDQHFFSADSRPAFLILTFKQLLLLSRPYALAQTAEDSPRDTLPLDLLHRRRSSGRVSDPLRSGNNDFFLVRKSRTQYCCTFHYRTYHRFDHASLGRNAVVESIYTSNVVQNTSKLPLQYVKQLTKYIQIFNIASAKIAKEGTMCARRGLFNKIAS